MENKELGIYIHIPFCQHKCDYCDFVSFSNKQDFIEQYVETIKQEIKNYLQNKNILEQYTVTTIYFGGGTPSYIESKYILNIMETLYEYLKNNKISFEKMEITLEVNPGTVNLEKLKQYRKAKINRLSIGLQSTSNKLLQQMGRIHNYEEFLKTYKLAKDTGFENINADLMIGLPNQTISNIKNSLDELIKLNLPHISVYSLIVEENTPIARKIRNNELQEIDEEIERNMYWYVKNTLELNGYIHYEISNFSKEGMQSRHNLNCWNQKEYIGIGLSAHSYIDGVRYANRTELEQYITQMDKFNKPINILNLRDKEIEKLEQIYEIEEIQNLEDRKREYMLLGLRTLKGVSISDFKQKYIDNPIFLYRKELEKLVKERLIIINGDYIKLTNKGLDLANLVWEEFV